MIFVAKARRSLLYASLERVSDLSRGETRESSFAALGSITNAQTFADEGVCGP